MKAKKKYNRSIQNHLLFSRKKEQKKDRKKEEEKPCTKFLCKWSVVVEKLFIGFVWYLSLWKNRCEGELKGKPKGKNEGENTKERKKRGVFGFKLWQSM